MRAYLYSLHLGEDQYVKRPRERETHPNNGIGSFKAGVRAKRDGLGHVRIHVRLWLAKVGEMDIFAIRPQRQEGRELGRLVIYGWEVNIGAEDRAITGRNVDVFEADVAILSFAFRFAKREIWERRHIEKILVKMVRAKSTRTLFFEGLILCTPNRVGTT